MNTADYIASAVRTRRRELGLTQQDLSDLSGASLRFIHDLENGKPTVQLKQVHAVVDTLGLVLDLRLRKPGE